MGPRRARKKIKKEGTVPSDLSRFRRVRAKFAPIASPRLIERGESSRPDIRIFAHGALIIPAGIGDSAVNPQRNGPEKERLRFDPSCNHRS